MSNFKIRAVAPTSYQLKSLSHFGLPSKKYLSGEHIGELFFDTEKEAKDHLVKRAELYYEDEAMLTEAFAEIEKYGSLQLDAVNGRIEEVEEETQEFAIVITETLKREVKVTATNEAEALEIVNKQYKEGDIVLDADDFIESEICPSQDLEISVLFGEDEKVKFFFHGKLDDSVIDNIKKHTFTTLAEKSAYIEGLEDNDGWGDYGILEEEDLVKIANFKNK